MSFLAWIHTHVWQIFILLFVVVNLVWCSWYVLHNDIYFPSDIARDFLLLQELDHEKIVLLGPRSSTGGLFHGPLWMYLMYPAYLIGNGNPLVVGWYWIGLIVVFLASSFVIAKKLFNEITAYLFILFLSFILIFETRALFNPHGAFFLLPAFFFFFIRALQTLKTRYLLLFFFTTGCIIQFQMAIGIPLLFLALVPLIVTLFKMKKLRLILSAFILLVPLSTFIVFDLVHDFIQTRSVLHYVFSNNLDTKTFGNAWGLLVERTTTMTGAGIGIFKDMTWHKNFFIFLLFGFFLWHQIKNKKYTLIYFSALYFYIGYYLLSLINKSGGMLYHYYMPLFPLVLLIFASFVTSHHKKIFWLILVLVGWANITFLQSYLSHTQLFFGKDQNSWQFLKRMAEKVYEKREKEIGYFIYMPDALAYQPKYAISYVSSKQPTKSYYFQKNPITYLVIAPPPPDKVGMEDKWWRINQLKLDSKPASVIRFTNGYKIERYELTQEQIAIPFDPAIDTGIHFR